MFEWIFEVFGIENSTRYPILSVFSGVASLYSMTQIKREEPIETFSNIAQSSTIDIPQLAKQWAQWMGMETKEVKLSYQNILESSLTT